MTSHGEEECFTCVEIAHFRQACALSWDAVADRLGLSEQALVSHAWKHHPCGSDLPLLISTGRSGSRFSGAPYEVLRQASRKLGVSVTHFTRHYGHGARVVLHVMEHGCLPEGIEPVPYVAPPPPNPSSRKARHAAEDRERKRLLAQAAKLLGMSMRTYYAAHGYGAVAARRIIAEHEEPACAG